MIAASYDFDGGAGRIHVRTWVGQDPPTFVALLSHGYGEHAGRYGHVAGALVDLGAAVYAPDHLGHGESAGERALVEDFEVVVSDLHAVADRAGAEHPGVPLVLVGHSMGGLIATRFAQRYGNELAALVVSGPVIGENPVFQMLLDLDPIPEIPIDPAVLSRNPAIGEAYAADPLVYHGPFRRPTLQAFVTALGRVATGDSFGELPTLWVHGTHDQLVPYDSVKVAMERLGGTVFEHKAYLDAEHEVFNEINADEVIGDVTDFLRRTLSSV